MPVDRITLPVVDVDLLHAAKHQLQLSLVKVLQPLQRHHLIETVQEGFGLLFDTSVILMSCRLDSVSVSVAYSEKPHFPICTSYLLSDFYQFIDHAFASYLNYENLIPA